MRQKITQKPESIMQKWEQVLVQKSLRETRELKAIEDRNRAHMESQVKRDPSTVCEAAVKRLYAEKGLTRKQKQVWRSKERVENCEPRYPWPEMGLRLFKPYMFEKKKEEEVSVSTDLSSSRTSRDNRQFGR